MSHLMRIVIGKQREHEKALTMIAKIWGDIANRAADDSDCDHSRAGE